ncbi:hypothetical protein Hdeb2414_s0001g00005951 [Helianthus debilis subsp. tardiflorus]
MINLNHYHLPCSHSLSLPCSLSTYDFYDHHHQTPTTYTTTNQHRRPPTSPLMSAVGDGEDTKKKRKEKKRKPSSLTSCQCSQQVRRSNNPWHNVS